MSGTNFLFSGGPSLKFPEIGTEHEVTVVGEAYEEQQKDFDTDELLFWPDGNKRMQLVVPVETEVLDDEIEDDGLRRWYVKGQGKQALVKALRAAKRRDVEIGGQLRIRYAQDGPKEGKKKPPKIYEVGYVPPGGEDEHEVSKGVEKTKATTNRKAGASSGVSDDEPPF
jgi:hypothetical protein